MTPILFFDLTTELHITHTHVYSDSKCLVRTDTKTNHQSNENTKFKTRHYIHEIIKCNKEIIICQWGRPFNGSLLAAPGIQLVSDEEGILNGRSRRDSGLLSRRYQNNSLLGEK